MTSDMLSQEEVDALLKGGSNEEPEVEFDNSDDILTDIEKDALGEIGNISMGTAATTLSTLLNKKVNITTPTVSITSAEELSKEYEIPFVAIDVSYSEGLEGSNILILHTDDVKVITDLMLGKDEVDRDRELTELDLSAVGEAMNQMMGSSATSLSEMLMKKIDIAPPKSSEITFSEGKNNIDLLKSDTPIIKISFRMEIGEYIDSNIMQLVPVEFGKEIVERLMNPSGLDTSEDSSFDDIIEEPKVVVEETRPIEPPLAQQPTQEPVRENQERQAPRPEPVEREPVLVSKPDFTNFDSYGESDYTGEIDLVGDIPVEITVELGRTNKKIGEILEFGVGTVVELEKLVGEALNVYANGKYIAKGEVVVIEDNFGVRITEIENSYKKII